ncbi:hypothetical protein [Peribacillus muralis]|uniref:hypothetical protein n=1 Tax=Peribacillus muralis TaxID=264697 RepID=UPI0036710C84
MSYTVKTPSKTFSGERAGLTFENGTASFEDAALIPTFELYGFTVTEEVKEVAEKEEVKEKPKRKKRGE